VFPVATHVIICRGEIPGDQNKHL